MAPLMAGQRIGATAESVDAELRTAMCISTPYRDHRSERLPGAAKFVRARSVTHSLLPQKAFAAIFYVDPAGPK